MSDGTERFIGVSSGFISSVFAGLNTMHKYWPISNDQQGKIQRTRTRCLLLKMSAESMCNVCKGPSRLKCGSCFRATYCCKDHQKADWKNHKSKCPSFKIVSNEEFGRHLVATRVIAEGEVVMRESPIVAGPAQVTPPVCLGCHTLLSQFSARDCATCGWPVCSDTCEKSAAHRPECQITSRHKHGKVKISTFEHNLPHPSYQCLTVLRCLYLKEAQPVLWNKLMQLESHCQERMSSSKYNADQRFIAQFIPKFFNFLDFSSEEILKVAGIIQVNAHEVPLREPEYIAIYETASFLEHNCKANCMKSFTNSGELVIRAAGRISPGEHLSICYTDPLWGREMRRAHLVETKFFKCRCWRCSDPTEFGTHFNSVKCLNSECCFFPFFESPSVNDETDLSEIEKELKSVCQKCGRTLSKEDISIESLRDVLIEQSKVDKTSVQSCKDFLEKYGKVLHQNHHTLISIKLALMDLIGWPGSLLSLEETDLQWVITTCKELYELTKALIPAENRLIGLILYHLQFALRERDRRKATGSEDETDKHQIQASLQERKNILLEAYKLLSYEPSELPEGQMAIEAKKALESLEQVLNTKHSLE